MSYIHNTYTYIQGVHEHTQLCSVYNRLFFDPYVRCAGNTSFKKFPNKTFDPDGIPEFIMQFPKLLKHVSDYDSVVKLTARNYTDGPRVLMYNTRKTLRKFAAPNLHVCLQISISLQTTIIYSAINISILQYYMNMIYFMCIKTILIVCVQS